MGLKQTPSQTIGPFFAYGLAPEQYGYPTLTSLASGDLVGADSVGANIAGTRICIIGQVFDGTGTPVPDALIEVWQADAEGRYADPPDQRASNTGFSGFGRIGTGTDPEAQFRLTTIKPGSVGNAAPHLNITLFMRGLLSHLFTRIYFPEEEAANADDPVLASVPEDRRPTLIAQRLSEGGPGAAPGQAPETALATHRFDIHLQGDRETVFFDV